MTFQVSEELQFFVLFIFLYNLTLLIFESFGLSTVNRDVIHFLKIKGYLKAKLLLFPQNHSSYDHNLTK